MGCCASTSRAREADIASATVPTHSSSRNITAPSTRRPSHTSQHGALAPRSHDRLNTPLKSIPAGHLSQLPNAPTAPSHARAKPLTYPSYAAWTRARLDKERNDWWDTQVTGDAEIWGAIRMASQHLQKGELQEAQTMLDVTGCTCPTGVLWRGVYDATGVQYVVPEWVVVMPEGLVEESESALHGGMETGVASASASQLDETQDEHDDEVVKIRARLSHCQQDVVVSIRRKAKIGDIVEAIKREAKLDPHSTTTSTIRLAYGGRLYQNHETLESHPYWHFNNNYILTALVSHL